MEPLWSLAGATSGNRWQIGRPRKRRNQAKTVATGCDQLPRDLDGKQGVCRGLPPVAGGPLPAREGVDLMLHWPGLSLAAAVRARALVATAAGARLADHGSILSGIHLLAGLSRAAEKWSTFGSRKVHHL